MIILESAGYASGSAVFYVEDLGRSCGNVGQDTLVLDILESQADHAAEETFGVLGSVGK